MARKFDVKQFLIEKGERVALWTAGGLCVLMLITGLFWPGHGLLSKSASANADELKQKSDKARDTIRRATPSDPEGMARPDPKLLADAGFKPATSDNFRTWFEFFAGKALDDSKRRGPKVLFPEEFAVAATFAQVKSHVFLPNPQRILVLKGKGIQGADSDRAKNYGQFFSGSGSGSRPGGSAGGPPPMGSGGGPPRPGGSGGGPPPMGSGGGPPPMGSGGGPPPGGGFPGFGGGRGRPGMGGFAPSMPDSAAEKNDVTAEYVPVEKLDKLTDVKLADTILPVRMAIVAASFPYKKQLEEFKTALRLPSINALFNDPNSVPAFEELVIERREFGSDGAPKAWTKIDLNQDFKALMLLNDERYEPDDPKYDTVTFDGLVLGRPGQFREGQYPKVEDELKLLGKTIEDLKDKKDGPLAQPNRFSNKDGIKLFKPKGGNIAGGTGGEGNGGMPPMMPPGGGKFPGAPMGGPGNPNAPMGGDNTQNWVPPEYCLVRFLDVTVDPGKTYQYRFKIRMANPNYGRPDVAWPALAQDKVIESENWIEVPKAVTIPPETYYYAVDQKVLEPKEFRSASSPRSGQVVLQAHRWLTEVYPNPDERRRSFTVGDWAIAERMFVYRGESLAAIAPTKVPVWDLIKEAFTLATPGKNSRTKTIPVPFVDELAPADPVLVDFEGGEVSYLRTEEENGKPRTSTIRDKARTEVLILTPEGKLIVRDSERDASDDERKARYEAWKSRIKEVEDKDKPKDPNMKDPFKDPFKGGN